MTSPASPSPSPDSAARQFRAARQQLRASLMFGADFVPKRSTASSDFTNIPVEPAVSEVVAPPRPTPAPDRASRPQVARPAPGTLVSAPVADQTMQPTASGIIETKPRVLSPKQADAQARLDALRRKYEADAPHKAFVTDHHCIVFGDGDPCAKLMIIGEAPGAEEDKVGLPFVGRAGGLLEKMLGGMGIKRADVYITNVLKTRPPNNATPTADEAAASAPYLHEQIKIIGPVCILALGLPATKVLLNTTEAMSGLRGQWWVYTDPRMNGYEVPVMPTYHPAFLLRSYTRENREKVWSDLKMIMDRLGLTAPARAE